MLFPRKVKVIVFSPSNFLLLALPALLIFAAAFAFSPSITLASLCKGSPLKGITVALDPGHGGIDSGTHFEAVMLEKEIVLEIGLELRRLLELAGARVMITREKDEELSRYCSDENMERHRRDLRGRVELINASKAHFALSLHINSIYDSSVRGPITFYSGAKPENKRLAETVQNSLNILFSAHSREGQLMHEHPQESGAYYILNETAMPTVLVEMAFMSSPDDRELLKSNPFKRKIARAIFLGVLNYIKGGEKYEKPPQETTSN